MSIKSYKEKNPKSHQKKVFELYASGFQDFAYKLTGKKPKGKKEEKLQRHAVEACREIYAAIEIVAITNQWHGYQSIKKHRLPKGVEKEDYTHRQKVEWIVNQMIDQKVPVMKAFPENKNRDGKPDFNKHLKLTEDIIYPALDEGARALQNANFKDAARTIGQYAWKESKKMGENRLSFDTAFYIVSSAFFKPKESPEV